MGARRVALVGVVSVVVVALVAGIIWWSPWADDGPSRPSRPGVPEGDPAADAADAFAAAWEGGHLDRVRFAPGSGTPVPSTRIITAQLTPADTDLPRVAVTRVTHAPSAAGTGSTTTTTRPGVTDTATATATVTWSLPGERTWRYDVTIPLEERGGTWRVRWSPTVIEPSLATGEVLRARRIPATRGRIVDAEGASLVPTKGAVTVGIRKSRTKDPEATARTVAGLTGVPADALIAKVRAAGADDFVEVITLERAAYDRIRSEIQPLPGTVFREAAGDGGVPASFARAVLGTTGTATPELVEASKGRLQAGDIIGLSGIQASQDATLGGTPGLVVEALQPGGAPRVLQEFASVPGKDVTVTLDQRIQEAADAAMATAPKPAALVAIRVSTGDVVAVANGPAGADGYNRALVGRYPPGSTFKIVTTLGLLEKGLTPDTTIACPATIVMGKKFANAEGEVLGNVPFRTDFAKSCNTAFVGQARDISAQELTNAAASLGFVPHDIGVRTFDGSVPATDDLTEHAANMIGQGKVEASPFAMALVSASVAKGETVTPRLVLPAGDPGPQPGPALPADKVGQLRDLMRGVVTSGTGTAVLGIPGGPVSAKTGTAEFGQEDPPETHAWFTGFQGDIAFAVLVEGGGFGGQVAAPIAARFLSSIAG